MRSERFYWAVILPVALVAVSLLVGLEQQGRQASVSTPVVMVNPLGATPTASLAASAPSETSEARVEEKAGNGGDGGQQETAATPASTTSTEVSQLVESPPVKREVAGSSPALGATPDVAVYSTMLAQAATPAPTRESEPITDVPASNDDDLMGAIQAAFPPSEWETAYRVAMCESGGDPTEVGAAGEEGAFQVVARFHGPVPADLYGQAMQAAEIVSSQGSWSAWSCY